MLDPARYRFDYVPAVQLPRKSRTIRIEHALDVDAGNLRTGLDVGNFQLSLGRPVGGNVTVRQNTVDLPDGGTSNVGFGAPAPNAVIRFYRVTSVEGESSSVLIGEGITDNNGRYSVILPDHPMGTSPAGP